KPICNRVFSTIPLCESESRSAPAEDLRQLTIHDQASLRGDDDKVAVIAQTKLSVIVLFARKTPTVRALQRQLTKATQSFRKQAHWPATMRARAFDTWREMPKSIALPRWQG